MSAESSSDAQAGPPSGPRTMRRNERSDLLMDVFCVSSFCIHNSDRVL